MASFAPNHLPSYPPLLPPSPPSLEPPALPLSRAAQLPQVLPSCRHSTPGTIPMGPW